MEARAGERRSLSIQSIKPPLSSILSPLLRRGARKHERAHRSWSKMREGMSLDDGFLIRESRELTQSESGGGLRSPRRWRDGTVAW